MPQSPRLSMFHDASVLPEPLSPEMLRWIEHVHVLEFVTRDVPRRTASVASALALLDRRLPMSSREIAQFARTGHETVRRSADALERLGLIDRHRRPYSDRRGPTPHVEG